MQDILEKLLAEAEARGDLRGRCRVLLDLGQHYTRRDDANGALRSYQLALKCATDADDPELEERALEPLAVVLLHLGGVDEALAAFERLREVVGAAEDGRKEARVCGLIGALQLKRGALKEASRYLARAAREFRRQEAVYDYYAVIKLLAESARRRRMWFKAAQLYDEAIGMAERASQIHEVDDLLWDLADVQLAQRNHEAARVTLERGLTVARALDDPLQESCYLLRLSDLDRAEGHDLDALRRVRKALDLVEGYDEPEILSRGSILLGSILQRQGQDRAARAALAGAARRGRRAGLPAVESDALTAYAWLLLRARDPAIRNPSIAIRAARRVLEIGPPKDAVPVVALARGYRRTGDRRRANEWAKRAQMIRGK